MSEKKTPAKAKTAKKTASAKPSASVKKTAVPKRAAPTKKAAPAKTAAAGARRMVAKVSPMRGMEIDAWIEAKASGWQGPVVRRVLEIVAAAVPDASVAIKWGQPVVDLGGPLAFVRAAKAHVTLGFWRGAELSDPKGLLEGSGDRMAHWKLGGIEAIDESRISAFATEAARLNLEKGDPTKRKA